MENEMIEQMLENAEETPVEQTDFSEVEETAAEPTQNEETASELPDYERMAEEDLLAVRRICPRFGGIESLSELPSASRFGELRELGLSVSEALGALGLSGAEHDGRAHLRASVPRRLGDAGTRMTPSELESAKRLFPRLSEREIARLYRRVNQ